MNRKSINHLMLFVLLALTLAFTACGGQDVDDGGDNQNQAATIKVTFHEEDVTVTLADAETTTVDDEDFYTLDSVVALALPDEDLTALYFNFVGTDGFTPLDGAYCDDLIPMSGEKLDMGLIQMSSNNLMWTDAAAFPGCMGVKDLGQVLVYTEDEVELDDPNQNEPYKVTVEFGEDSFDIALEDGDTGDLDGKTLVTLSSIVALALPNEDLTTLFYDFEGADGFSPDESDNCVDLMPLSGDNLQYGYINPETYKLIWDNAADLPGCLMISDLAKVIVTAED